MLYHPFTSPGENLNPGLFAPMFDAGVAVTYGAGQVIYMQGQEPEFLYCLREGSVRTSILSQDGEEKLLTVYSPGSIFGEASFFDGMPRVSTAVARTDSVVTRLGKETVGILFRQHPELVQAMLAYLARTVRMLSGHVNTMSFQPTEERLRTYLLSQPNDTIRMTQEELAAALNVSRVTVSRILRQYSAAGLLDTGYGSVTLRDRGRLEAMEPVR